MLTGLDTRYDLDSNKSSHKPREKSPNSQVSFSKNEIKMTETESFYTTGRLKKNDFVSVNGFCSHCNTVFGAMDCFYDFFAGQKICPNLTEEDIQRGS